MLRRLAHGAKNRGVVEHEHAGIGHEELETGDAFTNELSYFFELRAAEVGDDAVEGVVGDRFGLGFLHPGVESLAQGLSFVLDGEIDERGGAAKGCGDGAGFEIVRAGGAAEGHVEVGVHVDAAGEHEVIGGVDDAAGVFDRKPCADGGDLVANNADVGGASISRGDDRAVTNYRVQAHRLSTGQKTLRILYVEVLRASSSDALMMTRGLYARHWLMLVFNATNPP